MCDIKYCEFGVEFSLMQYWRKKRTKKGTILSNGSLISTTRSSSSLYSSSSQSLWTATTCN